MQAQALAVENPLAADFALSDEKFAELKVTLTSPEVRRMTHSDVEAMLQEQGRELLRRMFQDHLHLRGMQEVELGVQGPVVGSDGVVRTDLRRSHRSLGSVFGDVRVDRLAHHTPGSTSLHPLDAALNLPGDKYSFGVRRRAATEATRGSFDQARESIVTTTGSGICKRQVQELVVRSARDFTAFYEERTVLDPGVAAQSSELLVLTTDAKGVVMRRNSLRRATARAASRERHKLTRRLSRGEKRNRKRMAQVAAVYTIAPFAREPEDVVRELDRREQPTPLPPRPRPEHKRVWASVEHEAEVVIGAAFDEARLRDPQRSKTWVALSDGNTDQLRLLKKLSAAHGVQLTIVLDLIHVAEYLWNATTVFNREGSPEAEAWVSERLLAVLRGKAVHVAAGIRRSATKRGLSAPARRPADKCATYLLNHRDYLHYDQYLAVGLPISTGVIEGACRHLVKDRMDITGARWGLQCAEAVLKLRALRVSDDFDEYWHYHERLEQHRNHAERYANAEIPAMVAPRPPPTRARRGHLSLVP